MDKQPTISSGLTAKVVLAQKRAGIEFRIVVPEIKNPPSKACHVTSVVRAFGGGVVGEENVTFGTNLTRDGLEIVLVSTDTPPRLRTGQPRQGGAQRTGRLRGRCAPSGTRH